MSGNSPKNDSESGKSKFKVTNTQKASSYDSGFTQTFEKNVATNQNLNKKDIDSSDGAANEVKERKNDAGHSSGNNSSFSGRGVSPQSSEGTPPIGPRSNPVQLITPRYQKKSRTNRRMDISDSTPDHSLPTEALRDQRTETMTIRNGPLTYDQTMHFHTYDIYKSGKNRIVSRSVGYSSEGDLVLTREDMSEPSDVDMGFHRKTTELSEATVLDPKARRPLTDTELNGKKKIRINRPRYKKYPGVHAPRNRKLRNRLMNDYFANDIGREILEKARNHREEHGDDDEIELPPAFTDLPPEVLDTFDLEGEEQEREMERLGIAPIIHHRAPSNPTPVDPDSPEYRFRLLNTRLRGELQHAFTSEYLSAQIEDLEANFVQYIKSGPTEESLCFNFRDGYGRLVCHGVATYYQLVSQSKVSDDGEHKYTYVHFQKGKKDKNSVKLVNLPQVPLMKLLRSKNRNLPTKHSLSVNNTPQQAPKENVSSEPMTPLDLGEGGAEGEGAFPGAQNENQNETVYKTVQGKLTVDALEVYVPKLLLNFDDFEKSEETVKNTDKS